MILDTNAISAMTKGNPDIQKALRSSKKHSIPAIVIGEFLFGLKRSRLQKELTTWLTNLEKELDVLTVDRATATFYAEIKEALRSAGRPIPENDIWIAALARQHGLAILSRDTDFDYVHGITRFGW